MARLIAGEPRPGLSTSEIQAHLQANQRSADSLIGAFRTTGDPSFLREAMARYPDDPKVAFLACFMLLKDEPASAEERRIWIDRFKESAPENSLPSYLAALEHLRSDDALAAYEELVRASAKREFRDYNAEFLHDAEETWRAAGYSEADAKTIALFDQPIPYFASIKELTGQLVALAEAYRRNGNVESARLVQESIMKLGDPLRSGHHGGDVVGLIGIAIQEKLARSLPPDASVDSSGTTAAELLARLIAEKQRLTKEMSEIGDLRSSIASEMTDAERISVADRAKSFGELNAWRWFFAKRGITRPPSK